MHEEVKRDNELSPSTLNATSIVIGLLVENPDELAARAVAAGATELSPVQDYDYGYRQGTIRDPFGHHWCLERMDDFYKKHLPWRLMATNRTQSIKIILTDYL